MSDRLTDLSSMAWPVRLVFWFFEHQPAKFFVDWHARAYASRGDALFDRGRRQIKLRDVLPGPPYSFSFDLGPFTDAHLKTLLAKWPSGQPPRRTWAEIDAELAESLATPLPPIPQMSADRCQFPESSNLSGSLSADSTSLSESLPKFEKQPGVCE